MAVRVEVLAVGQGMCNLIIDETLLEHETIVNFFGIVDCGSEGNLCTTNKSIIINYIYGFMRDRAMTSGEKVDYYIDFLMFSHADADHINFIHDIVENMRYPDRDIPRRYSKTRSAIEWYQEHTEIESSSANKKDIRTARISYDKVGDKFILSKYQDKLVSENSTKVFPFRLTSHRTLDKDSIPIDATLDISGSFPFFLETGVTKIKYINLAGKLITHKIEILIPHKIDITMNRNIASCKFTVFIQEEGVTHRGDIINYTTKKQYYSETIELLTALYNNISEMKDNMGLSDKFCELICKTIEIFTNQFEILSADYSKTSAFNLDSDYISTFIEENKESCIIEYFLLGGRVDFDGMPLTEMKERDDRQIAIDTRYLCNELSNNKISNLNRTQMQFPFPLANIILGIMSYKDHDLDFYYCSDTVSPPDENDCSLICSVEDNGQPVALLMGDATYNTFSYINEYHIKGKTVIFNPNPVVMTAPHHGATHTSINKDGIIHLDNFVASILPQSIIISSGYRNEFGHPGNTVMQYFYDQMKSKEIVGNHAFFLNSTDNKPQEVKQGELILSNEEVKTRDTVIRVTNLPLYNTAGSLYEIIQLRYVDYRISLEDGIIIRDAFGDQDDIIKDYEQTGRWYDIRFLNENSSHTLKTINIINMKNETYFHEFINEQ